MSDLPSIWRASSVSAQRLVESFLAGRKASTLVAYRRDLERFAAFAGVEGLDQAASALLGRTQGDANALALEWRNKMLDEKLAPATINRRLSALRSLVELALTLGMIPWSLRVSNVKSKAYRDTRGPGTAAVANMMRHLEERTDAKGLRDQAVIAILWGMALRNSELCSLDVDDVDLVAGRMKLVRKWSREHATLTVPAGTLRRIATWVEVRGSAPGPLFTSCTRETAHIGGRLTSRSIHRLVREAGAAVGIACWPHAVRHASVTQALEDHGGDLRKVQSFSGHQDLNTLAIYDDRRRDFAGEVAAKVDEHMERKPNVEAVEE